MPLDFPNSPTLNQSYTSAGISWSWDGAKWLNVPQVGASNPSLNNVGRNLLHNPLFNVAQRGAGPWTTTGAYTLDRWTMSLSLDTVSITQQTLTDADRTAIGDEAARYSLQSVFTGNAGAGAYNTITHPMEDGRRYSGKTLTVSFWAKAASGTPKMGINVYRYYGTGGSPSAAEWLLTTGVPITISTTWTRYNTTIAIPSAVGKTFGTNNNDYTGLQFWLSSGATLNATSGNIGVQSGTIALWGLQLEVGSVATPLEKPDPQQDLAKCERFFIRGSVDCNQVPSAAAIFTQMVTFSMRAAPTIAFFSTSYGNASGIQTFVVTSRIAKIGVSASAGGGAYFTSNFDASADL